MAAYVYNLTPLTGRKRNVDRRIVIQGFDVRRRSLIVFGIALALSLPPSGVLALVFGPVAFVIVPPVVILAAFVLIEGRSRRGLQLALYRSLLDKRRANIQDVFICWRPVPRSSEFVTITAASMPREDPDDRPRGGAVFTSANTRVAATSISSILEK